MQDLPESNCLICGQPLVYQTTAVTMQCHICGASVLSNTACEAGHFICDTCHSAPSHVAIFNHCMESKLRDPLALANELMHLPSVNMHGPEHHVLVGSALLPAFHNSSGRLDLREALTTMQQRGNQVPGGICGFWGSCGAAISTGIFISIVSGSTPLSSDSWGLANRMTADALNRIAAIGGPRCCKRDSFLAIQAAVAFVAIQMGVVMEIKAAFAKCPYVDRNKECLSASCPFF